MAEPSRSDASRNAAALGLWIVTYVGGVFVLLVLVAAVAGAVADLADATIDLITALAGAATVVAATAVALRARPRPRWVVLVPPVVLAVVDVATGRPASQPLWQEATMLALGLAGAAALVARTRIGTGRSREPAARG